MIADALILAGGRSSRLGGSEKSQLRIDGMTLLEHTIEVVRAAGVRQVVVVGDHAPDAVRAVREEPPFGGPVAAIAAGLDALPPDAQLVLVLATDMPGIAAAIPALVDPIERDGAIALDRGRRQHLAMAVRPASLRAALARVRTRDGVAVRDLLTHLDLREAPVADGCTDDIDTWDDAARLGAVPPTPTRGHP